MNIEIYTPYAMPPSYKSQILSLLRQQWPEGFTGKNGTRDWISREEFHPVHAVLTDGDTVLAHAGIVWKDLEHAGKQYKTYGLSGVFTHPYHRKKGYGQQVISEAKRYIERQDGDIVLFVSCLIGFYCPVPDILDKRIEEEITNVLLKGMYERHGEAPAVYVGI